MANYKLRCAGDTTAVGSYPRGASPYGALDMAGNVQEWVNDWYGDYRESSSQNPSGPSSGGSRVLRDGPLTLYENLTRSADRNANDPGYWHHNLGFRCVSSR